MSKGSNSILLNFYVNFPETRWVYDKLYFRDATFLVTRQQWIMKFSPRSQAQNLQSSSIALCRFVLRQIYQQDDKFLVSVRYWNIASQTLRVNDIFPKSHLSKYELLPCRIMTKLEQRLPSSVCKFQLHLSLLYVDICEYYGNYPA